MSVRKNPGWVCVCVCCVIVCCEDQLYEIVMVVPSVDASATELLGVFVCLSVCVCVCVSLMCMLVRKRPGVIVCLCCVHVCWGVHVCEFASVDPNVDSSAQKPRVRGVCECVCV